MFSENSVVLVDADSVFFRIACVLTDDKSNKFVKRNWKRDMRQGILGTMNTIKRECMTDNLMIAVKGPDNFRPKLYPDYKANRPDLSEVRREALNYGHSYMCDELSAVRADGMEADDLVSIWAYECMEAGQDYYIAGIDKDLKQIPGNHYNFVKSTHEYVDHDAAHRNLMLQCLTGDNADNIPGIKGIGPKKAERILSGVSTGRQWNRVRAAWRAHKAGDPTTSWRLLSMLKSWEEYEDVKRQVERQASLRERNVLEEGKANKENEGLRGVSDGDLRSSDRHTVAVRRSEGNVPRGSGTLR